MNHTEPTSPYEYTRSPQEMDISHDRGYYDFVSDEVTAVIEAYKPRMAPSSWTAIREFVLEAVRDVGPPNRKWAVDSLGHASKFVLWTWQRAGLPLDRKQVFAISTIDRYILTLSSENQRTVRLRESLLHRISEAIGNDTQPRRISVVATDSRPYTDEDLAPIFSWARSGLRPRTRQDAWAILGFCGGAGLRASELVLLKGKDVEIVDGRYVVHISGDYPRSVPIRPGWESSVKRAMEGVEPEAYVAFPHGKAEYRLLMISTFQRRTPANAPRCARLRVTWVAHYVNELPIGTLLKAAGYKSPSSLGHFADCIDTPADAELVSSIVKIEAQA